MLLFFASAVQLLDFSGSYPGVAKSPGKIGENRNRSWGKHHLCEGLFLDLVSWSVNPQVVGSSPTRGAMKKTVTKVNVFFIDVPIGNDVMF